MVWWNTHQRAGFTLSFCCLAIATRSIKLNINDVTICHVTSSRFLSFALSSSFLRQSENWTTSNWNDFTKLVKPLSPAYLRFGGTIADRMIFKKQSENNLLVFSERNWVTVNNFVNRVGAEMAFGLNVMLRNGSNWDPENAKRLLLSTKKYGFKVHFQLGNEPNSFQHVFNYSLSAEQLSEDFFTLKNILKNYWSGAQIIGPDVTRPKNFEIPSQNYLEGFLKKGINAVDAVSWHQYYVNGHNATIADFLNPKIMNLLRKQIQEMSKIVRSYSVSVPIWLSETGSAYGGGAPRLSDKFASVFFFIDKLGVSAQEGISVVARQSLHEKHYSLIDDQFSPNPDYWLSLLYKQLVGHKVFCNFSQPEVDQIRIYIQSVKKSVKCIGNQNLVPKIVLFGMNLSDSPIDVLLNKNVYRCATYIMRGNNLKSSKVYLNDKMLSWKKIKINPKQFLYNYASITNSTEFQARSVTFWVLALPALA